MFEFTESIDIEAGNDVVWQLMSDLGRWWPKSNPEHDQLQYLDDPPLHEGSRLRIKERIAGIPGVAVGTITRFEPGKVVTWEADGARYRLAGLRITLDEGVRWELEALPDSQPAATRVSATVWARFPGRGGSLVERGFRLGGGVRKDREHARTELAYLKRTIES
jgi:hypothetical protein